MTDRESKCPDGRDPSDLLAYVDGDLDQASRSELEGHLEICAACSAKVESLTRLANLLKSHSEAFHPNEEELYRFVAGAEDPEGLISGHVESCSRCKEDVALLREMIAIRSAIPDRLPKIPNSLARKLERLYPPQESPGWISSLESSLINLMKLPFRMPVLALGTACAVLIIALTGVYIQRTFHRIPQPSRLHDLAEPGSVQAPAPGELAYDEATLDKLKQHEPPRSHTVTRGMAMPHKRVAPKPAIPALGAPTEEGTSPDAEKAHDTRAVRKFEPSRMPAAVQAERAGKKVERRKRKSGELGGEWEKDTRPPGVVMFGGSPRAPESSAEYRGERIPVTVRVVDGEGRPIPWLTFRAPDGLKKRYTFLHSEQPKPEEGLKESVPGKSKVRAFGDHMAGGRQILVRVKKSGEFYSLTASLREGPENRKLGTAEAFQVRKEDLRIRITSLVTSLLSMK